jgi:methyltransferase-like protein
MANDHTAVTDIVEKFYDEAPYVSLPFPASSPDHLAAVAYLFGVQSAPPHQCRVLELGGASGGNLIPHALKYPGSEYVGIDLSQKQIDEGLANIQALGLQNIRLLHMNLANIPASLGQFDYIICHGVYSWVSAEVQTAIMHICQHHLTRNGLAFISYKTYPGWKFKEIIRDVMQYGAIHQTEAKARLADARSAFDFLADSSSEGSLMHQALHENVGLIRTMRDDYLMHEYMEPFNRPCYLHELVQHAQDHGLSYLADAAVSIMFVGNLKPAIAQSLLDKYGDSQVQIEQHMDFLSNRQFRQTILAPQHRQAEISYQLDRRRQDAMYFAGDYSLPEGHVLNHDESPQIFLVENVEIVISTAIGKAAMKVIGDHFPATLTPAQITDAAQSLLQRVKETDHDNVNRLLKSLIIQGAIIFRIAPAPITGNVSERPVAYGPALAMVVHQDASQVTNIWHATVQVSLAERLLLRQLNGNNNEAQLSDILLDQVAQGMLQFKNADGSNITDPDLKQERAMLTVQQALQLLCKKGLLAA